jgi:hypothetical protein
MLPCFLRRLEWKRVGTFRVMREELVGSRYTKSLKALRRYSPTAVLATGSAFSGKRGNLRIRVMERIKKAILSVCAITQNRQGLLSAMLVDTS